MKTTTLTTKEIKEAKALAYRNFFSTRNIFCYPNCKYTFDLRTRVGQKAKQIVNELKKTVNVSKIKELKRQRASNRQKNAFTNILDNPIVKDYVKNKHSISFIGEDRLNFGYRNHWAKDSKDREIIKVLAKYHYSNGK